MNPTQIQITKALKGFNSGRSMLILVPLFTLINCICAFAETGYYFLFSLYSVYFMANLAISGIGFLLVPAVIILGGFVALYFLSKTRLWGMLVAIIYCAFDTLFMIGCILLVPEFAGEMAIYVIFNIGISAYLIVGYVNGRKLKKLSPFGIEINVQQIRSMGMPSAPNAMGNYESNGFNPNGNNMNGYNPNGFNDGANNAGAYDPYNGTQPEGYDPFDEKNDPNNRKNESPFAEFEDKGNSSENGSDNR